MTLLVSVARWGVSSTIGADWSEPEVAESQVLFEGIGARMEKQEGR